MDDLISLAIHIGRLEQRISDLEKRIPKVDAVSPPIVEEEEEENVTDKLFMEGIDNILGYQWPPVKKDGDE